MDELGTKPKGAPWWWPDARGWVCTAIFVFTGVILWMIDRNPKLLESAPFMTLAGGIAGVGGLGLILAFHFGSSSGTKQANERADNVLVMANRNKELTNDAIQARGEKPGEVGGGSPGPGSGGAVSDPTE